jgi:hypothetical protein
MPTGSPPRERARKLPPAWVTDLPVLALLVGSWLLIAVPWAHLATGLAALGWVAAHLATRRRLGARLRRRMRSLRAVTTMVSAWALLLAMAATTVTGALRWAGVPREAAWHGGTGYLLLAALLWHLWVIRRPLRARTVSAVPLLATTACPQDTRRG